MNRRFGSVRKLPPQRMQNIRRMFEEQSDGSSLSAPSPGNSNEDQSTKDSYENLLKSPAKTKMAKKSPPPVPKWRDHIKPTTPPQPHDSPTRKPRGNASPVRNKSEITALPVTPGVKPAPRKTSIVSAGEETVSRGLEELPIARLGQIMSGVALSNDDNSATAKRVSKLIGQLDSTPQTNKDEIKKRPPASNSSPVRTQTESAENAGGYTKLWDVHKRSNNNKHNGDRPVSVFERSKMFETTSITPTSGRPGKPPVPVKKPHLTNDSNSMANKDEATAASDTNQSASTDTSFRPSPMKRRSQSERKSKEKNDNEKVSETVDQTAKSETKLPKPKRPLYPPSRQQSLTEPRRASVNDNAETEIVGVAKIADKFSAKQQPPDPPSKPPRTHVHDDYIKVKLEKEKQAKDNIEDSYEDCDSIIIPKVLKSQTNTAEKVQNGESNSLKWKPLRPPPPRTRPRPFSIATDTMTYRSSDESSDSEIETKNGNPFYETVPPAEFESRSYAHNGEIRHWDLPRQSHPEPIRRSLSDDCIHKVDKAVDNEGNVVYMDPDALGIQADRGYDIYVDSTGYAVPNRVVKRALSMEERDEPEPSRPIGGRMKSKLRRFKNLFSEAEKSPSSNKMLPHRESQKNKLDIVKQKVNQAFEVLQGSWHHRRLESEADEVQDEDEDTGETSSNDSESRVDEKEIRKRVEYSRSVRIKTSASIRESKKYSAKKYPQLFEYAMIVSLQFSLETGKYEPFVKYKFPEIKQTNVSVPQFCFPDAANFKPSTSNAKSQSYNFVLTNFDGGRVYGYCRRLLPPKSLNKIPEVICVISPVDAFVMYNTLLQEIDQKRRVSLDLAQELIAAAFGRPLPAPGQSSVVRTLDVEGEMETIFLTRETESRIDNANVECLLSTLGVDKLIKVFASILLERSVLFCAKHLGVLSSTIHAIISLLYPFSWQHTFIPVLPSSMIDVVCSPTPYIIGITASLMQHALSLPLDENVLVVDLDKRSLVRTLGDEGTLLPKKMEKALKTALNMCRIDADAKGSPNLMISEAFLRFFVEVVGHYGQCILTHQGGQKTFEKEEFVGGSSSTSLRQLLEWFVETQMFEVFMTNQLERTEWGDTIEYFQSRIQEYKIQGGRNRRQRLLKR